MTSTLVFHAHGLRVGPEQSFMVQRSLLLEPTLRPGCGRALSLPREEHRPRGQTAPVGSRCPAARGQGLSSGRRSLEWGLG